MLNFPDTVSYCVKELHRQQDFQNLTKLSSMSRSRLETILLGLLGLLHWFLATFLIADRSHDDDYRSTNESSSGNHPGQKNGSSSSLQEALKYFDVAALDDTDFTRESIRKKYKRLSLVHHPDRNNGSPESVKQMQLVNLHYGTICRELDRREGILGDDDDSDAGDAAEPGESSTAPKDKEEQRKRKKARQNARRQQQEEIKKQREKMEKEMEEEMRREWEEMERRKREFRRKQKGFKQDRRKTEKKYRKSGLDNPQGRHLSHQQWLQEAGESLSRRRSTSEETSLPTRPRNLIMELSASEVGTALRMGETEIAIEVVHEAIGAAIQFWAINNSANSVESDGGVQVKIDSSLRNEVLRVLLVPLDQDGNHLLHYAVYFEDNDMVSYLIQEARHWERFAEFITSKNLRGFTAMDYALLSGNKSVEKQMTALWKEAQDVLDSRKLVPTFWRLMGDLRNAPSIEPAIFSAFGLFLGYLVFETGWFVSLVFVGMVVPSGMAKSQSAPSTRQVLLSDPGVLPGEMLIFHGLWCSLKMAYWGLAVFVPWIADYSYVSIPLLVIACILIPQTYLLSPLFWIIRNCHASVAFLAGIIPLSKSFPRLLKAICWLFLYLCLLLLAKTLATQFGRSLSGKIHSKQEL